MSTTSLPDLLRDHIGHRTTLVEPGGTGIAIRCLSCARLLDLSTALGLRPSSTRPTSTSTTTSSPPPVNDPANCPTHPGNWAHNCGRCRADTLAGDPTHARLTAPTGTDPTALPEWQAAREHLAQLNRDRNVSGTESTLSPPDPQPTAADGGTT